MGAIALRWLAWPHANSEVELVLMMLPFMLVGPFIQSHRKSAPLGFDYCMVLLLLSYPVWPLSGTFGQSLAMALAVTAGPLIALVAYWLIFPTNLRRRRETLIVMMIRELETMAGSGSAADHSVVWRSRLNHRVLRLVRWTDRLGGNDLAVRNGGLAVLALGNVILHIEALLREPTLSSRNVRILKAVLRRLKSLHRVPASAGRVLDIAAARLVGVPAVRPELFRMAALGLASNEAFFRRS
jgi:hypothetical protein